MQLFDLPLELLDDIFGRIPPYDLHRLRITSREMHAMDARCKFRHRDEVDVRLWPSLNALVRDADDGDEQARLLLGKTDRFTWNPTRCAVPDVVGRLRMLHVVWDFPPFTSKRWWSEHWTYPESTCPGREPSPDPRVAHLAAALNRFRATLRVVVVSNFPSSGFDPRLTFRLLDVGNASLVLPRLETLTVPSITTNEALLQAAQRSLRHLILGKHMPGGFWVPCPELRLLSCGFECPTPDDVLEETFPRSVLIRKLYHRPSPPSSPWWGNFRQPIPAPDQTRTLLRLLRRVEALSASEYAVAKLLLAHVEHDESPYCGCLPPEAQERRLYIGCSDACRRRLLAERDGSAAAIGSLADMPNRVDESFKLVIWHRALQVRVGLFVRLSSAQAAQSDSLSALQARVYASTHSLTCMTRECDWTTDWGIGESDAAAAASVAADAAGPSDQAAGP